MEEQDNPILQYMSSSLVWNLLARLVTLTGNLAISLIIVRLMPQDEVGEVFYLQSLAFGLAILVHFAMDAYFAKAIPEARKAGREGDIPHILLAGLALAALTTAGATLIAILAQPVIARYEIVPMHLPSTLLQMVLAWALLSALQRFVAGSHRAMLHADRAGVHNGALYTAIALCLYLVCALLGVELDTSRAVTLFLLALCIDVGLGFVSLRAWLANPGLSMALTFARRGFGYATPLVVSQLIFFAATLSGPLILGARTSLDEVAVFSVASRIAIIIGTPLALLNPILLPLISSYVAAQQLRALQFLARLIATVATLFSVACIAVFAIDPTGFLQLLFGADYAASALPCLILCVGVVIEAATGSNGIVLNQSGHQRLTLYATAGGGALALIPAFYLAQPYGAVGVACCFAAASLLQQSIVWLLVYRRLGINTGFSIRLAYHLLVSPRRVFASMGEATGEHTQAREL